MTTPGNEESLPELSLAQKQFNSVEDYLNKYEASVGLGKITESNVDEYLNLTEQKLRSFSAEKCGEGAYLLNLEALYVQREINRHQAQVDFLNGRIRALIASTMNNYGTKYTTTDDRKTLAINGNDHTKELQKLATKSSLYIARLAYLPNHLKSLASVLLAYQNTKMRSGHNEATRPTQESSGD